MNRFSSKFSNSPNSQNNSTSINNGDLPPIINTDKSSPETTTETPGGENNKSWLQNVKGKIAKTVEEKYTEYKNEKEMRKLQQNPNASQFAIDDLLLESDDLDHG